MGKVAGRQGIAGFAEDFCGAPIQTVTVFFVRGSCRRYAQVNPFSGGGFAQDDFSHRGAADVAGTNNEDIHVSIVSKAANGSIGWRLV